MNNKSLMERLLEEGYPPEDIDLNNQCDSFLRADKRAVSG